MSFEPRPASSAVANQYVLTAEVSDGLHVLDHDENPDLVWLADTLLDA